MANLLKKIIERSKSRSTSPVKYPVNNGGLYRPSRGSVRPHGFHSLPNGAPPSDPSMMELEFERHWNAYTTKYCRPPAPHPQAYNQHPYAEAHHLGWQQIHPQPHHPSHQQRQSQPNHHGQQNGLQQREFAPAGGRVTQHVRQVAPDYPHRSPIWDQPTSYHYEQYESAPRVARNPHHFEAEKMKEEKGAKGCGGETTPAYNMHHSGAFFASDWQAGQHQLPTYPQFDEVDSGGWHSAANGPPSSRQAYDEGASPRSAVKYHEMNNTAAREHGEWNGQAHIRSHPGTLAHREAGDHPRLRTAHEVPNGIGGGGEPRHPGLGLPENRKRSSSARPRSTSPRKLGMDESRRHHSKSPYQSPGKKGPCVTNRETFDYLHPQCKVEGCSAVIIVESTRFLVCRHQLSHSSDFFRALFLDNRALPLEGVKQLASNEYTVAVSGLRHPPASQQFQWFLECTIPTPFLKDVADDTLETLMRLSRRFASKGLGYRCAKFIQENVERKPPLTALCWLNWVVKHRFDRATYEKCMPVVARLSLIDLEKHRLMMTESTFSNLLAMKLRVCYLQASKVFYTIHKLDHFVVSMGRCPACGRCREQGKLRILANPCNKVIGCERCMLDFGCELERKNRSSDSYQAFYQCEHGTWAFSDKTEDCSCQSKLYRAEEEGISGTATLTRRVEPSASASDRVQGSAYHSASADAIPIVTSPSSQSTTPLMNRPNSRAHPRDGGSGRISHLRQEQELQQIQSSSAVLTPPGHRSSNSAFNN